MEELKTVTLSDCIHCEGKGSLELHGQDSVGCPACHETGMKGFDQAKHSVCGECETVYQRGEDARCDSGMTCGICSYNHGDS